MNPQKINVNPQYTYTSKHQPTAIPKVRLSVSSYTESFYNWFASIGISRIWISRSSSGKIEKGHVTSWRFMLFILLRLNLYLKTAYLFYLLIVPQDGEPLDFLTCLGIGILVVLAGVAMYSDYYFAQIYPAFEVFCAFWDVQTNIYEKLSDENKLDFKEELKSSAKIRTGFHTAASLNAMIGLSVQYIMDPKGIMFTGALFQNDSFLFSFLMGFHEEVFLLSVWYQAVAIILIPNLVSTELSICLKFLTKELKRLEANKQVPIEINDSTKHNEAKTRLCTASSIDDDGVYDIEDILLEYQNLQIVSDRLEAISSFILLITQIIYFAQITSDVFVGIQLWRVGDTLSVGFYSADCTTGMGYWFFSLRWMGKLDEAMEAFDSSLKSYFGLEYKRRRLHLRMYKAFREVRVLLGPNPVRKGTAGEVIFELFNYYILAAMW